MVLDGRIQLRFRGPIPSFTLGSSDDRRDRLSDSSPSTLRELISRAPLKCVNRGELENLAFLFDDSILF